MDVILQIQLGYINPFGLPGSPQTHRVWLDLIGSHA